MLSVKELLYRIESILKQSFLSVPKRIQCNVCGWSGRRFLSDSWHPHTICPRCLSQVRHRLLVAALSHIEQLCFHKVVDNKRVLHFAPENMLTDLLTVYASSYATADLMREDVDMKLDISSMSEMEANSFDVIVACDVLEHVENDVSAVHEIYRLLSAGGYAILTVPQKDNLAETLQDSTVVTPEGRERMFGQCDHLRIYGDDFSTLLESAGFEVTIVSEENFNNGLVQRHVLFPPVLSSRPLATNYRKVFFADKV